MKLRVRYNAHTHVITVDDLISLTDLTSKSCTSFDVDDVSSFMMSLNGTDALIGEGSAKEAGVCTGDLVHIIPKQQQHHNSRVKESNNNMNIDDDKHVIEQSSHASTSTSSVVNIPVNDVSKQQTSLKQAPLLIRQCVTDDMTLPDLLHDLYNNANIRNADDALVVSIHVLMLESAFTCKRNNSFAAMPSDWRSSAGYAFTYSHPLYPNTPDVLMKCISLHGTVIIAVAVTDDPSDHVQLSLITSNFVCRDISTSSDTTAAYLYKSLPLLSRTFYDSIIAPTLSRMAALHNTAHRASLLGLPCDMLICIFSYLHARDLCSLNQVCRVLFSISNYSPLWSRLIKKDFPLTIKKNHGDKNQYRGLYRLAKDQLRQRDEWNRHRHFDDPITNVPLNMPRSWHPDTGIRMPGTIGGNYDRFPSIPLPPQPTPFFDTNRPPLHFDPDAPSPLFPGPDVGGQILPPGARFDPIYGPPGTLPPHGGGRGRGLRDHHDFFGGSGFGGGGGFI